MRPGVAAGHPATAEVGAEILAEAGRRPTRSLRWCSRRAWPRASTAASGRMPRDLLRRLARREPRRLRRRSVRRGELVELPIAFGSEPSSYSIGPASCAVPGLRRRSASCGAPGPAAVEAARRAALGLARRGAAACDARAFARDARRSVLPRRGADLFVREGRMLREGRRSSNLARADARDARKRVPPPCTRPARGSASSRRERRFTADDLRDYRPRWADSVVVDFRGHRVATRGGLSGVPELCRRFPAFQGSETERVLALVAALDEPPNAAASTRRTWSP